MSTANLIPSGAGDLKQIDTACNSNHYLCVDDPVDTPDDNTTVIANMASVSYEYDLYTAADPELSGTIEKIAVSVRTATAGGTHEARPILKTYSTVYYGTTHIPPASWETFTVEWATNPNTGLAWTWDEIAALQFGIGIKSPGSNYAKCTQVFATITYTEISSDPEGPLIGGKLLRGGLLLHGVLGR